MTEHIIDYESMPHIKVCTVCRGIELELPTNCPGEVMTLQQKQMVFNGEIDYIDKWIAVLKNE